MTTIPDNSTPHEENAQAIRVDLQRLVQGIPNRILLTPEQRRKFSITGHVDDDFLRRMILIIEGHPDIAAMSQITATEIRDHLNFNAAYDGVGEELALEGRMVTDTRILGRAKIAERALRALKIARSINTPAGRESLVPHLEAIDREFSRGRRRRPVTKKPEEPAGTKKKPEVKP